jgi:CheY-like chemotaxis protein
MLAEAAFGPLPHEAGRAARTAVRNLRRLSGLIDDVLQYQRLTLQGEAAAVTAPVDLLAVFRECCGDFLFRTGWSEDQLTIEVPEGLAAVLADEEMLRRVISNLLDNAQQHAGELVSVTIRAEPGPPGRVRVSVSDDGAGIPEELRERVFEPFVRSEPSRAGTGLGLTVVRSACRAHGSEVELQSTPGAGTTVNFTLPTTPQAPVRSEEGEDSEVPVRAPRAASLLVVDDDPDTLEFMKLVLGRAGYRVTGASSGREALLALGGRSFDLALVDMFLPGMDGLELCRRIKADRETSALPVYMFTARAEEAARARATAAGCDGYIVKPFAISDFLKTIREASPD